MPKRYCSVHEKREKAIIHCEKVGVVRYWAMDGEGRQRNNVYYQIELRNGKMGHLKNLTDNQVERLDRLVNH